MSYKYRAKPADQKSPGKRWQTVAHSAMEEVASKIGPPVDTGKRVRDLMDRKLANTKTSIHFGNYKSDYVSDAMENQRRCIGGETPEERAAQKKKNAEMKAALTITNFTLGDVTPVYQTVNQEAMANAKNYLGVGKIAMNTDVMEAVKKSSLHFGNESVDYKSVAHQAMEYRGNENNFSKIQEEVNEMKIQLRKHNFSFGNEKVEYVSDYNRGYGSLPIEAYRGKMENAPAIAAHIADCRACHYSLGNDKPVYKSNTHAALDTIRGHPPGDIKAGVERAKQMKAALVKTSIVIGDDEEYMH